jgi:hypothetical protein
MTHCPHGHQLIRFPISYTTDGKLQESRSAGSYCLIREGSLKGQGILEGLPSVVIALPARCQVVGDWFEVWEGRILK